MKLIIAFAYLAIISASAAYLDASNRNQAIIPTSLSAFCAVASILPWAHKKWSANYRKRPSCKPDMVFQCLRWSGLAILTIGFAIASSSYAQGAYTAFAGSIILAIGALQKPTMRGSAGS